MLLVDLCRRLTLDSLLSRSWFPVVYDEFLVKPNREFQYSIWLLPLTKTDDASVVARNLYCE
jgi:hypothetical protein